MTNRQFSFNVYNKDHEMLRVTVGRAEQTVGEIEKVNENHQNKPKRETASERINDLTVGDKFLLPPPQTLVNEKGECLRIDSQPVAQGLAMLGGVWRNIHIQNGVGANQNSYAVVKINQGAQLCFAVNREHQLLKNLKAGLRGSLATGFKYMISVSIERKERREKQWVAAQIQEPAIKLLKQQIELRLEQRNKCRSLRIRLAKNLHKIAKKSAIIEHVITSIERNVIKVSEKEGPHIAAKKIPIVSIGMGLYFAYSRISSGDYIGALAEVASGALADIPGPGTAVSAALDATLLIRDIAAAHADTQQHTELTENEIQDLERENASIRNALKILESEGAFMQSKMFGEGSNDSFFDESETAFTDDISKIHIKSSSIINGIQVEYRISGKQNYHGGNDGTLETITLDPDEKITKVEVSMCGTYVASLTFFTDLCKTYSFGKEQEPIENYELGEGAYLAAIKGHDKFKPELMLLHPEGVPAIGFTAK